MTNFLEEKMRASLTDLFTIRRGQGELVDDYLARFRMMKIDALLLS